MIAGTFLLLSIGLVIGQYFYDGKRFDIFNPKNLFQVYFIIQLPLVLYLGTTYDLPGFKLLSPNTSSDEILMLASLFFFSQLLMVVAYYFFAGTKTLPIAWSQKYNWNYARVKTICILLFILGYFSFFYLMQINGGYDEFVKNREIWRAGGMTGQGWLIFPATSMLSIAAIAFLIVSKNTFQGKHSYLKLMLLIIFTVLPATQLGFRGFILLPIIQIVFIYHMRIEKLKIKKIVPIFLFIILSFTTYGIYRESVVSMTKGFDLDVAINYIEQHPESVYDIFLRSKGADVVAVVIDRTYGIQDYVLFVPSIIESLTIVIPRAIWPNKPIPLSVRFSELFFGIGGGISPTIVGEAYWQGGLIGVFLTMIVVGFVFRYYFNTVLASTNNNSSIFTLTVIFPSLVMMAEAIQGYLNGIVYQLIFCAFMVFVFSLNSKKTINRTPKT